MIRCCLSVLFGLVFALQLPLTASAAGQARYFVLVVWDGMRPDFISEDLTPALYSLKTNGVWFSNHRSAYPTSTEVNGAVLATGAFPQRNGVSANKEYRPEIDPLKQFGTESLAAVRRGDELTGGKYLRVPTVAELVRANAGHTAVVGAKPVALLHDRLPRTTSDNPVWFAAGSLPESLLPSLTNQFGRFPPAASPNTARDTWAERCLTEAFWKSDVPRYSVLWLSEPDFSQHHHGPGSPEALAAIKNCDDRLAAVLKELDRRGIRDKTDVFVASDHGFSTIGQNGDVAATLRSGGLNASSVWKKEPKKDDIVVVGNGGTVLVYVTGHSPAVIEKVVAVLQHNPSSGVLFTKSGLPGTFSLAEAKLDSATAPDVIVASGWKMSDTKSAHPKSEITNDGYAEYVPGNGMHVTLSPTDLHNTAIAAGPDFKRGLISRLPSGNVDIAPTLLWLMDIKPPEPLDGRVLHEALVGGSPYAPKVTPGRREAHNEFSDGSWKQYLRFTEVDGVRYLDEGNGHWSPATGEKSALGANRLSSTNTLSKKFEPHP